MGHFQDRRFTERFPEGMRALGTPKSGDDSVAEGEGTVLEVRCFFFSHIH